MLVVDNASYHNVRIEASITSATKKADMIKWLQDRGIEVDSALTKVEIYNVIKERKLKVYIYSHIHELCFLLHLNYRSQ